MVSIYHINSLIWGYSDVSQPKLGQSQGNGGAAMEPTDAVLRGLLATAPDALLAVDPQGLIVYVNDQVEHLFGWARDELVGQPVECLVPERFSAQHPALRAGYVPVSYTHLTLPT